MISHLQGKIAAKTAKSVTIMTDSGVGYEVFVPPVFLIDLQANQKVALPVYLAVKEDSLELYGFKNLEEKELFMKFLEVSGVGPKSALHLLSLGTVEEISSAIAREDVAYLTQVSGIGKKTAERIVLELKSKIQETSSKLKEEGKGGKLADVIEALVSLGYSKDEARDTVRGLKSEGKNSEEILRDALKALSKR